MINSICQKSRNTNLTSCVSLISLVAIFLLIDTSITYAQYKQQNFEVTPFVGYLFPGNLKTIDGELKIENNFNYGTALDMRADDELFIEFLYSRADTEVRFRQEYFDTIKTLFDMSIEYFQAGAHVEVETGRFRPFAAFTLGATYFNPKKNDVNSDWRFSFTLGGGIKYYFTNTIGVRLQWRFLVPVYFSEGSIFCSDGNCRIFISGGTYLLQYDLTAGLVISL